MPEPSRAAVSAAIARLLADPPVARPARACRDCRLRSRIQLGAADRRAGGVPSEGGARRARMALDGELPPETPAEEKREAARR